MEESCVNIFPPRCSTNLNNILMAAVIIQLWGEMSEIQLAEPSYISQHPVAIPTKVNQRAFRENSV
jgi:hypothetical protein